MTAKCHPERSEGSSWIITEKYNFLYNQKCRMGSWFGSLYNPSNL